VPVINVLLAPAVQTRQRRHQLLRVPHFDMLGVQPRLHPFADQPAVHRIRVVLYVKHTPRRHRCTHAFATQQRRRRQRLEHRQLFRQTRLPVAVALAHHFFQKLLVRRPAGKIPTVTQQQRLSHRVLEVPVRRLRIAVLVRLPWANLLPRQSVITQQLHVTRRELLLLRQVVDRAAHAVAAVTRRHAAQLPQRFLHTRAQALEALRKAHLHRLPVRIGQHEMVHQVRQRLAGDGHVQAAHVREVGGTQTSRLMHLREVHFLTRTGGRTPNLDASLQGPRLALCEAADILLLQPGEQRFRLQLRLPLQLRDYFRPHLGERIGPGPPIMRSPTVTGQLLHGSISPGCFAIHAALHGRVG
jgi:hypothetical protein